MAKIWLIARHEYGSNFRRIGFRLMLVSVPLLGLIGLLLAGFFSGQIGSALEAQFTGGDQQDRRFGVVDESSRFTPILPAYQPQFTAFADEATGRAAVRAGEIDQLLVIAADYLEQGTVRVVGRDTSVAALPDPGILRPFFVDHLLHDQVAPELRTRLSDVYTLVQVPLDGQADAEQGGEFAEFFLAFFLPYLMGLLLVMTIFISGNYLLRSVAEEKESRIIELMLSSVKAEQLLAGKVLGLGALGLTQIVVWVLALLLLGWIGAQWMGLPIPGVAVLFDRPAVPLLVLVYYLLGFLVYAVLLGAIGALGTSMRESQQLTGFISVIALIPVMLGGFILPNPNGALARGLSYFPLTAPTMMMLRLPLTAVPLLDVMISIAVLLLSVPLVLWLGAKLFRLGLLLYGQRPGMAQIMQALRQA